MSQNNSEATDDSVAFFYLKLMDKKIPDFGGKSGREISCILRSHRISLSFLRLNISIFSLYVM